MPPQPASHQANNHPMGYATMTAHISLYIYKYKTSSNWIQYNIELEKKADFLTWNKRYN